MELQLRDLFFHLLAPILAGGLIGFERSYHGRPAGVRTHALVCASSSLLMMLSVYAPQLAGALGDNLRLDSTRMAQGIVTGIGFLGAGVIFKEGLTVRGLTTAASIWTTATIGILLGAGLHLMAACATAAALGVLGGFRRLEVLFAGYVYASHVLSFRRDRVMPEEEVRALVEGAGFEIASMDYRTARDGARLEYRMVIRTRERQNLSRLAQVLVRLEDVEDFRLHQSAA